MAIGLFKFIRIVSRMHEKRHLNQCVIFVQILGIIVWSIAWIFQGWFYFKYYTTLEQYAPFKNILITDCVTFGATFINVMIIAVVLYQSSKVVGTTELPQEITTKTTH